MNKPLLYLFTALLFAIVALPGISRAAPDGDDYIAVQVPNVTQAVTFFRDVMNCGAISDNGHASSAQEALMTCGRETTVEITLASGGHIQRRTGTLSPGFTLDIDDATSVAAWLRANHVHLIGAPARLTSGQDAGKVAVTFLTPWGQPLQLVSRMKADDLLQTTSPAPRVAVQ